MDKFVQALNPDPNTWEGLLRWVLTDGGLGLVAGALLWLVFYAYRGRTGGRDLPNDAKIALALAGPMAVLLVVYGVLVATTAEEFSTDTLVGLIWLGGRVAVGGQGVYAGVRLVGLLVDRLRQLWAPAPPEPQQGERQGAPASKSDGGGE